MTLPPQPNPSGIEVTHEDDPLTMEWRVRLGSFRRQIEVGACLLMIAGSILASAWLWREEGWGEALVFLLVPPVGVWWILGLMKQTGDARLVLHPDSLIWVPGGGSIPRVFRKSEILSVRPKAGSVTLAVELGAAPGMNLHLRGLFAPGDAEWLGDILHRWLSGTLSGS